MAEWSKHGSVSLMENGKWIAVFWGRDINENFGKFTSDRTHAYTNTQRQGREFIERKARERGLWRDDTRTNPAPTSQASEK